MRYSLHNENMFSTTEFKELTCNWPFSLGPKLLEETDQRRFNYNSVVTGQNETAIIEPV